MFGKHNIINSPWLIRYGLAVSLLLSFVFQAGYQLLSTDSWQLPIFNSHLSSYTANIAHSLLILSLISAVLALLIAISMHHAIQRLNISNQTLSNLIEIYPDAISVTSHNGKQLINNRAHDLLFRSLSTFTHSSKSHIQSGDLEPDMLPALNLLPAINNALQSGKAQELVSPCSDQQAHTLYLYSKITPLTSQNSQPSVVIYSKDITREMETQLDTQRSRTKIASILSVSREGLWEWDLQRELMWQDPSRQALNGTRHAELSLSAYLNQIVDADRPRYQAEMQRLASSGVMEIEYRIRYRNGTVRWLWDRAKVFESDEANKPLHAIGITQDISKRKNTQKKFDQLLYVDSLTGLGNKNALCRDLALICQSNKKNDNGQFGAIFFIDPERFKALNDAYGHQFGDDLLRVFAQRLNAQAKGNRTVYRFSGNVFTVVIQQLAVSADQASAAAHILAEELHHTINQSTRLLRDSVILDYECRSTLSGILFSSEDTVSEKLLQLADQALYRSKKTHHGGIRVFGLEERLALDRASELHKMIRRSLTDNQFQLYLCPKFDASEQVTGAEALIRWLHPDKGVIEPDEFLPVADENNLIVPIGERIITQACALLQSWQQSAISRHLNLSINISTKQLWHQGFEQWLVDTVAEHSIDASRLTLEITETMVQDMTEVSVKLASLRRHGFKLALDNFGTGYSSLLYLKSIAVDELKIDSSFSQDIAINKSSLIMVKSMIDIGKNFKLNVAAQGVETEEQLNLLRMFGVESYQGDYLAKPMNILDFDRLLRKNTPTKNDLLKLL